MDVASIASSLVAAQTGQIQMAMAAKMIRMNAESGQAVVQMLDAAQANMSSLANVAPGVGGNLNISV
jgi:hypothetical protein